MTTDYEKYRGKCKEFSEKLCAENNKLKLIRGWYHCPFWGKQAHWWCEDPFGEITDPTSDQFPSKGLGEYEKYNGLLECEFCGKQVPEDEARFEEHHTYCSHRCYGKDVGF